MEDLKRMAVFAAVVQHGSMSGAARALGMSTSAVKGRPALGISALPGSLAYTFSYALIGQGRST